jgi:hypothetical protein
MSLRCPLLGLERSCPPCRSIPEFAAIFQHLPWMQWGSLPPWEQKKILQFRGNVCALATRSALEVARLLTAPPEGSTGCNDGPRRTPRRDRLRGRQHVEAVGVQYLISRFYRRTPDAVQASRGPQLLTTPRPRSVPHPSIMTVVPNALVALSQYPSRAPFAYSVVRGEAAGSESKINSASLRLHPRNLTRAINDELTRRPARYGAPCGRASGAACAVAGVAFFHKQWGHYGKNTLVLEQACRPHKLGLSILMTAKRAQKKGAHCLTVGPGEILQCRTGINRVHQAPVCHREMSPHTATTAGSKLITYNGQNVTAGSAVRARYFSQSGSKRRAARNAVSPANQLSRAILCSFQNRSYRLMLLQIAHVNTRPSPMTAAPASLRGTLAVK